MGFVVSFEAGLNHSVSIILYSIVSRIRAVCCDLVVVNGLFVGGRIAHNDTGQAQSFCAYGFAVVSFLISCAQRRKRRGTIKHSMTGSQPRVV